MKLAQQLLWENDASSVPMTPDRENMIHQDTLEFFRRRGFKPEDIPDLEFRKEYAAWLIKNPLPK